MLDAENPVPPFFDSKYHCRYGVFQEWFYRDDFFVEKLESFSNRLTGTRRLADSRSFMSHEWSSSSEYVRYTQELLRAVEDDPEDAWVWKSTGWQLAEIRRYDDAIRHNQRATEIREEFITAWEWLAFAAYATDQIDLASEAFQSAYQRDAHNQLVLGWLCSLAVEHNRPQAAIKYAEALVGQHPESKSFCSMAEAQLINGAYDLARETISKTLESDPTCGRGRLLAAKICHQLGDHAEASQHWNRFLESAQGKRCVQEPAQAQQRRDGTHGSSRRDEVAVPLLKRTVLR